LVDSAEGGDIDGLTTDGTSRTDTGAVLAGTAVDDGIDSNLNGILVGHDVNNLECVCDDAYSHELLSVVATVHHEGVGEAFDDRALGFSESLDSITTGGVRDVDGGADLNVIGQGDISDLDILITPLIEQLDAANLGRDFLGENLVTAAGALNLDLTVVRHVGDV